VRNKYLRSGERGYHPLRKLRIVFAGLRCAVLNDFSVLYKLVLSVPVLVLSLWLHPWVDTAVILLATGIALAAELFNTAIEALCDFVESRYDEDIRMVKDIAAAAAGVAILAWAIVMIAQIIGLWPLLMQWWSL
jgi:diacylglycerol kinase (ATP)